DLALLADPVALPDRRHDREVRPLVGPVEAVGDARTVFPAVVAGKAVEREEVAVLQIDGARILIRNVEVRSRRREDELDPRGQTLSPAEQWTDERPFQIGGERSDTPGVPTIGSAVERYVGARRIVRVV